MHQGKRDGTRNLQWSKCKLNQILYPYRTEEESSLRSSAIDESGTAKSSLTPGLGLRNPNSQGGLGSNAAYYGLSDRSNPGSVATTPPQSLTPER